MCDTFPEVLGKELMLDRRAADRVQLAKPLAATLGSTPVRLLEVSRSGARLEHEERPTVGAVSQLRFDWNGEAATLEVTIIRSEISGRRNSTLIYQSGVRFGEINKAADTALAILIGEKEALEQQIAASASAPPPLTADLPQAQPVVSQPTVQPVGSVTAGMTTSAAVASFSANPFGRDDDDPQYIRCRLGEHGWMREYVESPDQPDEGFTVSIDQRFDVESLQQAYEHADREMRDMMRRSLAMRLQQ